MSTSQRCCCGRMSYPVARNRPSRFEYTPRCVALLATMAQSSWHDACNSCLGPPFHRNFGKLVLGCIDASDSERRRIFQHFSRSTRFPFLCTALNPEICKISSEISRFFREFLQNVHLFCQILRFSNRFSWNFLRIISLNYQRSLEIHRNCKFWMIRGGGLELIS